MDDEDELDVEERERLDEALDEAWKSVRAGHVLRVSALLDATSPNRT